MTAQTWSWWTTTRAVAIAGKTYASMHDENGMCQLLVWTDPDLPPAKTPIGSTGQQDDHNNAGLIVRPGKPVVAGYCGHSLDNVFRIKTSVHNVDDTTYGVDFTGQPETQIITAGNTTYAVGAHHEDDLFFFFRTTVHVDNGNLWSWSVAHSADDGATWSYRPIILNGDQFYGTFVRAGRRTIRVAMTNHPVSADSPDQNIYYAEINALSGEMTKADGTVIANIYETGNTTLMNEMDVVAVPNDGKRTWAYSVGDALDPEIVWGDFAADNITGTSRYQYSRRVAGVWRTTTLAAAGQSFSGDTQPYLGGVQLPVGGYGGVVYLSRNSGADWYVERHSSVDNGLTFPDVSLLGTRSHRLVRAWPVEHHDSTSSFEVIAEDITFWASYTQHGSTLVGLGRSSGPSVMRLRRDGVDHPVAHLRKDGVNYSVANIRQIA